VIWSAFHLAATGGLASVIFFGTFLALALFGTFSIDAKRRRKLGPAWDTFAAKTSNIPFAAVITRRNSLKIGESLRGARLPAIMWAPAPRSGSVPMRSSVILITASRSSRSASKLIEG
jgi:uncharacterized membrane protein